MVTNSRRDSVPTLQRHGSEQGGRSLPGALQVFADYSRIGLMLRAPLFSTLSAGTVEALALQSQLRSVGRRDVLFHAGDPAVSMYLVIEGRVKVAVLGAGGGETVIDIAGPGDILGELVRLDADTGRFDDLERCGYDFRADSIPWNDRDFSLVE